MDSISDSPGKVSWTTVLRVLIRPLVGQPAEEDGPRLGSANYTTLCRRQKTLAV